jgi:hypothetical protein
MFSHPDYDGHEALLFAQDKAGGLRVRSRSAELACQCLDHRKPALDQTAHHVDPPFLVFLARHYVRTQGRKSLCFQLLDDGRKAPGKRSAVITDKYDLKTRCQQVAADFIWCGKETDGGRGGPWQRIVRRSRRAGAGQR